MNNLMEILSNFKNIGKEGDSKNLSKFVLLLAKFNNGLPMSRDIITRIEDFFDYYWANDMLRALKTEQDEMFISQLPDQVVQQILMDFLFRDFLYLFKGNFTTDNPNYMKSKLKGQNDPTYRKNMQILLRNLEPRTYVVGGELIQDQDVEVYEVFYIIRGKVGVGYRLFNEIFLGTALSVRQVINDYAMLTGKVSEYLYMPIIEHVNGLVLRRKAFV